MFASAAQYTNSNTHSDASIPRVLSLFVFSSAVQGGSEYSKSIQYLQSLLPLPVPWIPLPNLYQAEVIDDSLFPPHTWQRLGKNRKENKGKRLSNYFKQHTKLIHCAELSEGQHPESCSFPAVWGEGNAKGISAELRKRKNKKKKKLYTHYRLPNELNGLACSDGFNLRTPHWCYTAARSMANKQTQCSLHAVIHHSGSLNIVWLHAALQTDPRSALFTHAPTLTSTC